ncbi:MAG: GatB/YqeY domain-containing protein [Candidatus Saganbacteria bacterium]|nr:GatB/YqeY domain-containing protein [Candidatus Saganbacteria bacterium]
MTNEDKKLFNQINEELKKALKNRDALRLSALRMVKSKILYVNARGDLPDAEITKIIKKYSKELKESITEFKKVEKNEEAATHEKELAIVAEFLPPELSEDEVKKIVETAITETGATSIKEMGKVMKEVLAKHPTIDGKTVSGLVREKLK